MTPTQEQMPDMMLTVRDVAELLAVGVRTVWRWARLGKIPRPVHLATRTVRWKSSDIQAYIDALSQQGPRNSRWSRENSPQRIGKEEKRHPFN